MGFLDNLKKLFAGKSKTKLPVVNVAKRFELLGRTGQGTGHGAGSSVRGAGGDRGRIRPGAPAPPPGDAGATGSRPNPFGAGLVFGF